MNYQHHYKKLIETRLNFQDIRKQQKKEKTRYYERHHIIPKCMGGTNDSDNLILLTAREHFISHRLLAKIFGGKLWLALSLFYKNKENIKITSRTYQTIKEQISENMTGRFVSAETRKKQSLAKKGKYNGKNHPHYGKKHSVVWREKNRQSHLGKKLSTDTRKLMSKQRTGKGNINYGTFPWTCSTNKNNQEIMAFWSKLDIIYKIWLDNKKPGYRRLYSYCLNSNILPKRKNNKTYKSSICRAITRFKTYTTHTIEPAWLEYFK